MSVLVIGLSHSSAPVPLLERTALGPDASGKLALDVASAPDVAEVTVLSTCNRLEVYAVVDRFHSAVATTTELLARHTGVGVHELVPHLYVHYEGRAVSHVLEVACGLDSMVVGEAQILGQVRGALRLGQELGCAGPVLNDLLQAALHTGKRAHSETGLDRAGASVVSAALDLGAAALEGGLAGRRALVVGAGSMSALAATTLHRLGSGRIAVANRTHERAERLADAVGGSAVRFDDPADLRDALVAADVVVTCTGSTAAVLRRDAVAAAVERRGGRPLVVVDLALPRDVEPGVAQLPGVTLVDLEALARTIEEAGTGADVRSVRAIVAAEVEAFAARRRASGATATVVALRSRAADVVAAELERLAGRVPGLDPRSRAEVESTVRRVVDKLLHEPTVRVKELAGTPGGLAYADALRELFDLDQRAVDAVTTPGGEDGAAGPRSERGTAP